MRVMWFTGLAILATSLPAVAQQVSAVDKRYRGCTPNALPAADRLRMKAEHDRLLRTRGDAAARAYLDAEGKRFHAKLVAQGVCPAERGKAGTTTAANPKGKKVVRDKNGRVCTKTRMAMRPVPGLGGAPMTMGMTPVCAD